LALVIAVTMLLTAAPDESRIARAEPPRATEYVGLTKCAACHFNQYKDWKLTSHGRAFEILPKKYKNDAECLQCHTTGFGRPSTVQDPTATYQSGVSCEACHGPGSDHAKFALRFVDEQITEDGLKQLRSTIHRISVDECVKCHVSKAHKAHPKFDRESSATNRQSQASEPGSPGFFHFKGHAERPRS
jgi:hypothetical protein